MVLNAATHLVVVLGKYQHITPVLLDVLHWLPVPQRMQFNIATLAFDCIRDTRLAYFSHVVHAVADIWPFWSPFVCGICWSHEPEQPSLADGAFLSLLQSSGTHFHHISALRR